jgi:hypothetical protein
VSKRRPKGLAENWCNTIHPSHRMLVLHLNRGLRRNLIITPRNRYVFRTEIEKLLGKENPGNSQESDEIVDAADAEIDRNAERSTSS